MSSPGDEPRGADVGLLTPVSAGTAAEVLTDDRAVVTAMLRAEAALLRALVRAGVAPGETGAAADAVAAVTEADVPARELAVEAVRAGNPTVALVRRLRALVGEEHARWVHFGSTSQDILDTALMLVASEVARRAEADLLRVADALARRIDESRDVMAVARTLTQQAMPTTLAMRLSGWLAGIHDAVDKVSACTAPPVSLGGPVGTAAAYGARGPAVLEAFAEELGLRAAVSSWHTRRTPMVDLTTAMTVAVESCGKIAADVLVMSQSEVGEAREASGGPSSAMAHKANPAQSVLVAAAARQLPGAAAVLMGSAAPEQERPAGAWHAEWQPLRTMLRLAGATAERTADLVTDVRFDHAAMRRNLDQLVAGLGEDEAWERAQTDHLGVWIDRVLAQHKEVARERDR
jgi:3-carboxy-cis,cis-muconate cycloisomerase